MCAPKITLTPPIERQDGGTLVRLAKASRPREAIRPGRDPHPAKPPKARVSADYQAGFFSSVGG